MNEADLSSQGSHARFLSVVGLLLSGLLGVAGAAVPVGGYAFLPNAKEAEAYRLIREDGQQQRVQLVLDPRLCAAARKQAEDTQRRKFFAHRNPDGLNANQRALNEGYPLPAHYPASENYIESMAGSTIDTPADAVARWRASSPHAEHVFAKTAARREQVVVGVGYAPASRLGYATYVLISAPPPVGQNGGVTSTSASRLRLRIAPAGRIRYVNAQPDGIFELWRTGPSLTPWTIEKCIVVDAAGLIDLGTKSANRGFFRLRHIE